MRTAIITSFPRAQRVEVYNEMARVGDVEFRVFYLRNMPHGRHWEYGPSIEHDAVFIPERRLKKHLYLSPGLLNEFRRYEPDNMVMTQYASPGMQMLMYYCGIKNIPWVFWSEAPYVRYADDPIVKNDYLRHLLRTVAMWPIAWWAKEIWPIGSRAEQEFRQYIRREKIYRNLTYYADLDRFFQAAERRDQHIGRADFLFSGSLTLRKGADLVADAIESLSSEGLDFRVTVIGKGPLMDRFKALSDSARSRVRMVGFVQLEDVPDYYANSNVLLFPSRHDGWGMSLVEGMASGMTVISTKQTGAAIDMIRHEKNGLIMDYASNTKLEEEMRKLIKDPSLITKLGREAKITAEAYTHTAGAEKFSAYINSIGRQIK